MPKLTIEIRENIINLFNNGYSQRKISNELGISKTGIYHTINRYKCHKTLKDLQKSGRKPKYTDRDARLLIRESQCNPKLSSKELKSRCMPMQSVSTSTVRRILIKYGLFGRIAAKKPKLNICQIKNRLRWCKDYSKVSSTFWSNVIFSDECRIELYQKRTEYVRRPINSRYLPKYTTKTVKFGGKSIMIWGAIKENGERYLVKANCNINSIEYQRIISEGLFPIYSQQNILQQDNAPCHKSATTLKFFDDNGICLISDWPSQSPDINIIEPLWKILKDNVNKSCPKTLDELWNLCLREWNQIDTSIIKKLYQFIPRRLSAVIKSKGQNTKY